MRAKRVTGPGAAASDPGLQALHDRCGVRGQEAQGIQAHALRSVSGHAVFDRTFPLNKPLDQSALTN